MKNEDISYSTKKKLAKGLKRLMKEKSLSKISISEIVRLCDVNRKTFYYHFESIEDLFKWMLEDEAVHIVKEFDLSKDYKKAIFFVMDYLENNQAILNCAYDSIGSEGLKKFFYDDFFDVTTKLIEAVEENISYKCPQDYKEFLTKMYAGAIAGMIIDYFSSDEMISRKKIANFLSISLYSSISSSLKNYKDYLYSW